MPRSLPPLFLFTLLLFGCGRSPQREEPSRMSQASRDEAPPGEVALPDGGGAPRGQRQEKRHLDRTQHILEEGLKAMRESRKKVEKGFKEAEARIRKLFQKYKEHPGLQEQLKKSLDLLKQQYRKTRESMQQSINKVQQQLNQARMGVARWIAPGKEPTNAKGEQGAQ